MEGNSIKNSFLCNALLVKSYGSRGWLELWPPFFENTVMSPEKSHDGFFFRNRHFHFKIRFGPFWIDSDQKIRRNTFLCRFFDLWSQLLEKMPMSPKNSHNMIFFDFEISILKNVLNRYDSIPIKKIIQKIFCEKNYSLFHFFDQNGQKGGFFKIFVRLFSKQFLYPLLALFIVFLLSHHTHAYLNSLWDIFKWAILLQLSSSHLEFMSLVWQD